MYCGLLVLEQVEAKVNSSENQLDFANCIR